jgi:hypothetical protein
MNSIVYYLGFEAFSITIEAKFAGGLIAVFFE